LNPLVPGSASGGQVKGRRLPRAESGLGNLTGPAAGSECRGNRPRAGLVKGQRPCGLIASSICSTKPAGR